MMAALAAGFVLGLIGSGHCAGMCGPIVMLANPRADRSRSVGNVQPSALAAHAALYHAGRLLTYVVLGMTATLGGVAASRAGIGRPLAFVAGGALIAHAIGLPRMLGRARGAGAISRVVTGGLAAAGAWMRAHAVAGPAVFGALNGLLPCGLLYMAMVAAAGLGSAVDGALFIAGFGFGTVPLLAAIGVSAGTVAPRLPARLRRLAPVALAVIGMLLIGRGLERPTAHVMAMPMAAGASMTMGR